MKIYGACNNNYNKLKEDIMKKIDITKEYEHAFEEDNVVEMYLKDKLKLKAQYCVLGLYNIPMSIWYWGWNVAFVNKELVKDILPIKEFADTLSKDYKKFDKVEVEELHYMVSNDNFYISGKNVDKLIKLALYLTKAIWCFPVKHNEELTEYILITKILQFS